MDPSHTPISRPTPLTISNGIQIQSAILPQYTLRTDCQTDRPTDRQTDRPTHGNGDRSVVQELFALTVIVSDAAKNRIKSKLSKLIGYNLIACLFRMFKLGQCVPRDCHGLYLCQVRCSVFLLAQTNRHIDATIALPTPRLYTTVIGNY